MSSFAPPTVKPASSSAESGWKNDKIRSKHMGYDTAYERLLHLIPSTVRHPFYMKNSQL